MYLKYQSKSTHSAVKCPQGRSLTQTHQQQHQISYLQHPATILAPLVGSSIHYCNNSHDFVSRDQKVKLDPDETPELQSAESTTAENKL